MELGRIIFRGEEIWRAYKNREIIWHQKELKFFDIGNTELFAKPIITYGQDVAKKISAGFILYEIINNVNFAIDQGKIWKNYNAFEAKKDISINIDLGQKINNLDSFCLYNKYDFNIDKAKKHNNADALLLYNQYDFNIDLAKQIKNDDSFGFYKEYSFYIDIAKKNIELHNINFILLDNFNIDEAKRHHKNTSIEAEPTKKINIDLGKKIKKNLAINFYILAKLEVDLAKEIQRDFLMAFYDLEKFHIDLADKLKSDSILSFSLTVHEHSDKGKKTANNLESVFLNINRLYSDISKIGSKNLQSSFLIESLYNYSEARNATQEEFIFFCIKNIFMYSLAKQLLNKKDIGFIPELFLKEIKAKRKEKHEQITALFHLLNRTELTRLLHYFFEVVFLTEGKYTISFSENLEELNYINFFTQVFLKNHVSARFFKFYSSDGRNLSLIFSSFTKKINKYNDIFTDYYKPSLFNDSIKNHKEENFIFSIIKSYLDCAQHKLIKQNQLILSRVEGSNLVQSLTTELERQLLIYASSQNRIDSPISEKTKIDYNVTLWQQGVLLPSQTHLLPLHIFSRIKSQSKIYFVIKKRLPIEKNLSLFSLSDLKEDFSVQNKITHTILTKEKSIYRSGLHYPLIAPFEIKNKDEAIICIKYNQNTKINFSINSLNFPSMLNKENSNQISMENNFREIGYYTLYLHDFVNKFTTENFQSFQEKAILSFLETLKGFSFYALSDEKGKAASDLGQIIDYYDCKKIHTISPLEFKKAVKKETKKDFTLESFIVVKGTTTKDSKSMTPLEHLGDFVLIAGVLYDKLFSHSSLILQDFIKLSYGLINDTFTIQEKSCVGYDANLRDSVATDINKLDPMEGEVFAFLETSPEYKWLWPIWLNFEKTNLYIRQVNCFSYSEKTIK